MKVLKIITLCLLIAILGGICYITVYLCLVLPQLKKDYTAARNEFISATAEWKRSTKATTDLWNSEKTQTSIGLLLRTGDDLNRGAKKFNATMDSLNQLIINTDRSLNQVTFPNANLAIVNTNTSVQETFLALQEPIKSSNELLKEVTTLVEDTNKGTTELTASVIKTTELVNSSIEENKPVVNEILVDTKYLSKRMGDIADVTYERLVKVRRWFVKIFLDVSAWCYRVFIKP